MAIGWHKIENSSTIDQMGYDPERLVMEVKFFGKGRTPGGHYRYQGVPATRWATMLAAKAEGGSVGSAFHREIRANHNGELMNPV